MEMKILLRSKKMKMKVKLKLMKKNYIFMSIPYNRVKILLTSDSSIYNKKSCVAINMIGIGQYLQNSCFITQQFNGFYNIQIYLMILGPISSLLFWKKPGITIMKNLKFWGWSQAFIVQTIQWIFTLSGYIFYFIQSDSMITLTEIILSSFAICQRCIVIAAQYATLSNEKIYLYRNFVIPDNIFDFDLTLTQWRLQSPRMMYLETYRSLRRREKEQSLFYFQFMVDPSPNTTKAVNATEIDYVFNKNDVLVCLKVKQNQNFCGFKVIGFLIQEYQKQSPQGLMFAIVMIESLILALTPIFYKIQLFTYYQPSAIDIARIIINSLVIVLAFGASYVFLFIALLDFQRKIFLLDQCKLMIATSEDNKIKKLLPTISLHNPQTLYAWSMLRSISFDYGQTFNLRTQGFYSLIFLGCIALLIFYLGIILDMIIVDLFQLILLIEITIILYSYIIGYLYYGATINSYFDQFAALLQDIKTIYMDVRNMKEDYFKNGIQPQNKIHRKFVQKVKQYVDEENLQEVEDYINIVIAALKDNIASLQYDQRNNPFKLYGVTITFNILKSIGVGLSTVVGFAIQQRFSQRFKQ